MRPSLNILDAELIGRIVDEAKRVLAEVGFEIRGPEMRRRLVEAGLPQTDAGRILFPRHVVERAIAEAPGSFILYDRDGATEYLQAYTKTFEERFFFEIVERRGYKGFGAANAPIRLAAQARLARDAAVP